MNLALRTTGLSALLSLIVVSPTHAQIVAPPAPPQPVSIPSVSGNGSGDFGMYAPDGPASIQNQQFPATMAPTGPEPISGHAIGEGRGLGAGCEDSVDDVLRAATLRARVWDRLSEEERQQMEESEPTGCAKELISYYENIFKQLADAWR
ncbi:MAG: hypothetical protein HYY48_08120 [Gammaproteobacteria bacterium]|nr:hypothetical protein [Gammaproteobacteria bacterium]